MSPEKTNAPANTSYDCPHCGAVTVVPNNDYYDYTTDEWVEGGYFDGWCACGEYVFAAPDTDLDDAVAISSELLFAFMTVTRSLDTPDRSEQLMEVHGRIGEKFHTALEYANALDRGERPTVATSFDDAQATLIDAFRDRLTIEHALAFAALSDAFVHLYRNDDLDQAHAAMTRALDALTRGCKHAREREASAVETVNSLPCCGYVPA